MNETLLVPPVQEVKDRRTGLMIFGILVILLGLCVGLMAPLMLVGQVMAQRVPGMEPTPMRFVLPAIFMYLGLAAGFIWLGIGSTMCRRWARALLLILSWMWLLGGIVGIVVLALILPQIFAGPWPGAQPGMPPLPEPARLAITVVVLAISSVIYVVIPSGLVVFYRSRHVKTTCEIRDPVARWTDACPLPVLALSLMLGLGAATMPLMMVGYHSIVPCFGTYLSGAPGAVILLVTMILYGWGARANYKLNMAGWWVTLLGFGLWMLSAAVTFARVGMLPMYELMEFPKTQLDLMRQMGFLNGPYLCVMMLVLWLPFFGFLIYTRKFFKR